jgi:O-antigen/teichoic acid export membrane protein
MRIAKYLEELRQVEFVRRVMMLSGATIFAQSLVLLALPLLTRLYTPADFGIFSLYSSALGVVTVIAGLRFELAASLPEDDVEAMHVVALAVISTVAVALLAVVTLSLLHNLLQLGREDWLTTIYAYRLAIGIGVLAVGFSTALQAWSTRKGRFGLVSRSRLLQALLGISVQTGMGAMKYSATGLVLGHIAYCAGGIAAMASALARKDRLSYTQLSLTRLRAAALKYKSFPIYSVPEALFNAAGWYIPIIMIGAVASADELGQLQLATRVIGLPMALLGASVAQVYLVEAPQKLRTGSLKQFTLGTMGNVFKVAALPMIVLAALSPVLFPWIFGPQWTRAGQIVLWLAPAYVLQIATSPVGAVLHVTGKLREAMLLQLTGFIIRVGMVFISIKLIPIWSIEIYAFSGALFFTILYFRLRVVVR